MRWNKLAVARVRNWSLQSSLDLLDVTNLGHVSRNYVGGYKSATGSATIFYHDDDKSLRMLLDNCITTDKPSSAELHLQWGDKKISLMVYVTAVNITCSTGEVMSADVQFTMSGNYTAVTL